MVISSTECICNELCVRSEGCEVLPLGEWLLVVLRTWMEWVVSAWLCKGWDVCLCKLSVPFLGQALPSGFNAYLIIKPTVYLPLWRGFQSCKILIFNYISPATWIYSLIIFFKSWWPNCTTLCREIWKLSDKIYKVIYVSSKSWTQNRKKLEKSHNF